MSTLAPVALFVYNRVDHTRRTVDALKQNLLAKESDLVVFSDAAKSIEHEAAVAEVRRYLSEIGGFKSLRIVERKTNFGLARSVIDGVGQLCDQYGKVIVLEDDLETSPFFLQYMNNGLNCYELSNEVISIHGYVYPTGQELPETFFLRGADCWGWATWKRGWDIFDADAGKHLEALSKQKLECEFNFDNNNDYTGMIKAHLTGKINSWAICWYASAFLANKLTLYPGVSLVQNIGNDGSGTHSHDTNRFHGALATEPVTVGDISVEQSRIGYAAFSAYFRAGKRTLVNRMKSRLVRMAKAWI